MSKPKRQLHFNVFMTRFGHHPAAWKHPASTAGGRPNLRYWIEVAKLAERGKLDAVFLADFAGIASASQPHELARQAPMNDFEPYTLAAAIAGATSRVGVIATVNTNYDEPYNTARRFASLDHVSDGRAGWNVVSSLWEGSQKSFGVTQPLDHTARYQRAGEFVDVAKALWDSWEDDSFDHADRASGIYLDPNTSHPVHHRGAHFTVDGLLDIPRPVQGYPVFVQAGNSDTGKEFAAQYAEMTYSAATSIDIARGYYNDLKGRMAKYGRDPDHLKVTPGLSVTIGRSDAEAQDKFEDLQSRVDFSNGVNLFGYDLSAYPLDGPLPDLPEQDNSKGRIQQLTALARRENLTIRQLYLRFHVTRGHRVITGTPVRVADQIEDWFTAGVADGFNLIPPIMPGSLEDFVNLVIPELQRRDLFRKEYEGTTLREHLGLPRPENRAAGLRRSA